MGDFLRMEMQGDWEQGLDRLATVARGSVVATGAAVMSRVFRDEAKARAPVFRGPVVVKRRRNGSTYTIKPGQLRDAIYRVRVQDGIGPESARYEVSWNHTKAPHGWWMENGNARHAARPFIRPAFYSAQGQALQEGLARMRASFSEALAQPIDQDGP